MPLQELTLVLLKPDSIQRGFVGEIISRFEKKGFKIVALKMLTLSIEKAEQFYNVHRDKKFFSSLINYIISGPIIAVALEGRDAVKVLRNMIGATNPAIAEAGSVRGDYAMCIDKNIIHASDSLESANYELSVIFNPSDYVKYTKSDMNWVYE